jgi:hypothetical protein
MNRREAVLTAAGLLPYTTGLTAIVSVGLVSVKVWRQPSFPFFAAVLGWAIAAVVVAVLVTWVRPAASIGASAAVSWIVALQLGVLLLVIPLLLLTVSMPEDNIPGWLFPVLNKRWLIALYDLAIVTFLVFPVAVERWRTEEHAPKAEPNQPSTVRPATRWRWVSRVIGTIGIVAVVWYFAGPPWNLHRHHRVIDWHEQLHLGSLQAISKGYLPYIGPASTVYGPGSQILTYAVMTLSDQFDIVSFRTSFAVFDLAALLILGIAACWWLGMLPAVAVVLLAFTYSPMAFYYTISDGTFAGFYGWANPLRYLAPLLVVPSLARVACWSTRARDAPWLVLLGIVWGIGAWIAQENLSMTVVAGGLLLTLLWLTRAISLRRAIRSLCYLVIGFGFVAIPIVLYYAFHGTAGEFLRNYFLNPRAVAMGYSNTWWPAQDALLPERYSYYFTPPFLIALAGCTLWRLRPLGLVSPLDFRRIRFLAFVCIQLICYQTSLFRSDNTHLRNTMIALPFVLVLGFWDLPQWLAASGWGRSAVRGAFIVLVLAIYPVVRLQAWETMMTAPMFRFKAPPPSSASASMPDDDRVAFKRATRLLSDEPILAATSGLSVRSFLDFASELHDTIGPRKTYIAAVGSVYTGLLYFMADLTPAPYPLELETMVINRNMRDLVIDHMRAHPEDYECFIGTSLSQAEAQVFLDGHPGALTLERNLGPTMLYVLLAQTPG